MNMPYPYHGKRNDEPPIPEPTPEPPKIDVTELPISTEETKWEPVELTEKDFKNFKLHIPKPLTPYDADQIKTFLQSILTGMNETDYKDENTDHYHYAIICLAAAFATTDKIKLQKITNYPHKQITQTITNLCKNNLIKRKNNPIHQLLTSDNGNMALTLLALVAAGEMEAKNHKGHWLWKTTKPPTTETTPISSQETTTPQPTQPKPPTTEPKRNRGYNGGKSRMTTQTPQQRSEIAAKGAKARWDKYRQTQQTKWETYLNNKTQISSQETRQHQTNPSTPPSTTSTNESPTSSNSHQTQNGPSDQGQIAT